MKKLGVIGAGTMGSAIIRGLISTKSWEADNITVTNKKNRSRLTNLQKHWKVNVTYDKKHLVEHSEILIIAVKPQDVKELIQEIKESFSSEQLIISVVAGLKTKTLEQAIGKRTRIIRTMPNIAASVGESATAIAKGRHATEEDTEICKKIFCTLGKSVIVNEELMDIVTALSGSGPAYIYYLIEAMKEGAIKYGMPEDVAHILTLQTLWGASELSKKAHEDISILREKITSPGGTTEKALKILKEKGLSEIISMAMKDAANRSKELSQIE